MKVLLSILVFLCLIMSGTQDVASVEVHNRKTEVQISSVEKTIKDQALQHRQEQIFDLAGNSDYIQILSKLSRERIKSNNTLRLVHKCHSDLFLKEFNTRQRISELVSIEQIIAGSSLYYRYAHFIYELRKIII